MMDNPVRKPQWEQAADAVDALGGKATRQEVWEYLKHSRPDLPFSTVTADLNAVAVNSVARTSYNSGREPRRSDAGNRFDRLFKVGSGPGAHYVRYDPKVHGVWEIYPDPAATSTHRMSIRRVDAASPSMTVTLSDGAIKPGNSFFPVKGFDDGFFPASVIRPKDPDGPASPVHFTTDAGTAFQSDIYRASNTGYLHNRSAARAYYETRQVQAGDQLRFEKRADGGYHISHLPSASIQSAQDPESTSKQRRPERHMTPVNKILFGPPGTGKTYRTVNETLALLDPQFLQDHMDDRPSLKGRFDELVEAGRVRFVTFHQSFSYEDFVEGIRANADEATGALRYEVEDGVFKQMCEAASSRTVADAGATGIDIAGRRIWKVSLGDAGTEGHIFDECLEDEIALLGFGYGADLTGVTSRDEILQRILETGAKIDAGDYAITALDQFVRRMVKGDLVVVTHGNLKFRAIGEVTGDYFRKDAEEGEHYVQARPVRWLRRYDPPRPYADLMENRFSQATIYELRPGSINLDRLAGLLTPEEPGGSDGGERETEARVLIIDEINRGNVSRIFGEVITLIEPSKRAGCPEALEVTLPYSKERFSVPRNLHLIGTMNTADRSLAGLDVALRRRFEFVEMLPDTDALAGIEVAGVPVSTLLATMNRRIEILLGRDYMLGHAYFMPLSEDPSPKALAEIFLRRILPLLQEYFFEDWQRIAWVLNDHRKPRHLCFLQRSNEGMNDLLGPDVELPREGRVWTINTAASENPEAYQAIIKAPAASA